MPLCCVYKIISLELKGVSKKLILQMAVKAINDFASPDGLIPILLVFSTYPWMIDDFLLSPSVV